MKRSVQQNARQETVGRSSVLLPEFLVQEERKGELCRLNSTRQKNRTSLPSDTTLCLLKTLS
jgi:hypothetical protein